MRLLNRVLWREGMHLSQHHFQAQGRYVEDTIATALGHLVAGAWGVTHLALDDDAVRNGVAVLRSGRGVMPDGQPFHMPDADTLPPAVAFAEAFLPSQQSHVLHLVVRQYRADAPNVGEAAGTFRYRAESHTLRDAITGADESQVELAARSFRLLLDVQLQPDDIDLPIARITRDGTGGFRYDANHIPPCTKLTGSERLLQILAELTQQLQAKNDALVAQRREAAMDLANYAAHEVAGFWMLHTIRSHLAGLRHHLTNRESHPERLYLDLARLVGELSTFTLQDVAREVPAYNHRLPGDCFPTLARLVSACLETVVQSAAERVVFGQDRPNYQGAAVPDERAFRGTVWILGAQWPQGDMARATRVPQLVKVCSRAHIERLVQEGRAALTLTPLTAPPAAISPRPGTAYFEIQQAGPCWEAIRKTGQVGAFVPDVLAGVVLDVHIVRTDSSTP